jgi:hypothetical protein
MLIAHEGADGPIYQHDSRKPAAQVQAEFSIVYARSAPWPSRNVSSFAVALPVVILLGAFIRLARL